MGRTLLIAAGLLFLPVPAAIGQTTVSYTSPNSVYSQNFDGLPASGSFSPGGKGPFALSAAPVNGTGLPGWQYWMPGGSNNNAVFAISTGSSTGNGIYSFGASGSPERALGSLSASSGIYSFGLILTNNTGIALNNCTVAFTMEQWRRGGSGNPNTWAFRYRTGNFTTIDQMGLTDEHALDLVSVQTAASAATLNGNLTDNQRTVSYTIRNLNWKNGEQLLLRWDDADETGSDDGCAIDNFSFSAQQISSAPAASITAATNITSNSAILNGTVNDNFARSWISFEYDTSINFIHAVILRPAADTIEQGAGNTSVTAVASGLETGINYFFRLRATNAKGTTISNTASLTTAFSLPVLSTDPPSGIMPNSVLLNGNISSTGGTAVTEKGFVWSTTGTPALPANKSVVTGAAAHFSQTVQDLPAATVIYAAAFATNSVGTAYGNTQVFTTPTTVLAIRPASASLTNSPTVNFTGKFANNISGLNPSCFEIVPENITAAIVTAVTVAANVFTVTVNTGSGDGKLS
ncbi:MAG: hypothetical protein JO301_06910, partial [Chitinophagaceae bacterium]|nr:hypothetical protein [Chitinophagaceae bacterium]